MAADNKSLGRFKLTGIPPAPRGVAQVQVAFDIDANGILQVTARDKTTGREQRITIQGASTLSEMEIERMMDEAARFAQEDRERRERVEKRNRAKALTDQAQRKLKEVTLDFGNSFVNPYRRRVDALCAEIIDSLQRNDEQRLDRAQADLQDTLYDLNREIRLKYEDEEEGFFQTIKKTFVGDDEKDDPYYSSRTYTYREPEYDNDYNQRDNPRRPYRQSAPYDNNNRYGNDRYNNDRYDERSERSYYNKGRSRNIPYQNDWDEEDDDWF